jgi:hypothetical protein
MATFRPLYAIMIAPSFHVPASVAPLANVTTSRYKDCSVVTPSHSGANVQVWSVPML